MVDDLWQATHGEPAAGRTLLDVGGGPGYFADGFENAGFTYIGVEPDPREMHAGPGDRRDGHLRPRIRAWRCRSPTPAWTSACRRTSPSMCREPWRLAGEMLRVTRPGGLAVLSYTVWLGPFGGHEMGLDATTSAAPAPRPATPASTAIRPKNDYGSSLFAVSAADGLDLGGGHRRAASPHSPATTHDGPGG